MLFRGILTVVLFAVCAFTIGNALLLQIGWKRSFSASYAWGFVFMLAVFQLLAYPMFRIGTSFMLLFWAYSAALAVMFILSFIVTLKNRADRPYLSQIGEIGAGCRKYPFLFIVLIGAICFSLFMSLGFYYSSSDDGYYITRSMESIVQNRLDIGTTLAWQGRECRLPDYKDCSTFVFFIAYLSKLSGIQATILSKTFFLINLLFAHYASVTCAAAAVFEKKENLLQKKAFFMIVYLTLQTLAVKEASAGTWMTGYLWEGKAVLIAVVFPLMLSACITLYRKLETFRYREWITVFVLIIAGIELSIIGVFLPVILYFTFGASILICGGFRQFKRLWKPVLITALPVIIFACLSYYSVVTGTTLLEKGTISASAEASERASLAVLLSSWLSQFRAAADLWQFILYGFGTVYLLFIGSKAQKVLLVLAPAVLLLTFLNPLFSDFVSKYITTPIVYWRLFWLFPVYIIPATVLTDITDRITAGKMQNGLAGILLTIGILSGFEMFRNIDSSASQSVTAFAKNVGKLINVRPELRFNIYNLNPAPMDAAEMIEADWSGDGRPNVLFCFNRPYEMRLYSTEIELASQVRNNYEATNTIPGTDIVEADFISTYSEITDGEYLREVLDIMEVNYVCFNVESAVEDLEGYGFRHIGNTCGIIDIWKLE